MCLVSYMWVKLGSKKLWNLKCNFYFCHDKNVSNEKEKSWAGLPICEMYIILDNMMGIESALSCKIFKPLKVWFLAINYFLLSVLGLQYKLLALYRYLRKVLLVSSTNDMTHNKKRVNWFLFWFKCFQTCYTYTHSFQNVIVTLFFFVAVKYNSGQQAWIYKRYISQFWSAYNYL